jgi:hypothetical protein
MQCRDAQFYLRLRGHANQELGADCTSELNRHLLGCSDCARDSDRALSFDRSVATAMKNIVIPSGLRDKLATQVLAYRGAILRRRIYRATALAASLLLMVGVGYGIFSASRPRLDTDALVMRADEQIQDPEGAIQKWLSAGHFPAQLPLPFNTDLLISLGSERIQGHDVPVMVFGGSLERGFAKIYLLRSDGAFNLDPRTLRDAQASNTHAIVLNSPSPGSGLVYVIVYTGHDLQPFLRVVATG